MGDGDSVKHKLEVGFFLSLASTSMAIILFKGHQVRLGVIIMISTWGSLVPRRSELVEAKFELSGTKLFKNAQKESDCGVAMHEWSDKVSPPDFREFSRLPSPNPNMNARIRLTDPHPRLEFIVWFAPSLDL